MLPFVKANQARLPFIGKDPARGGTLRGCELFRCVSRFGFFYKLAKTFHKF